MWGIPLPGRMEIVSMFKVFVNKKFPNQIQILEILIQILFSSFKKKQTGNSTV